MQIEINKNNRITCVCYVGGTYDSIEVEDFQFEHSEFDYKYIDGQVIYQPISNNDEEFINRIYDENSDMYTEGATDLEKVQAQISEYSELDTPSTLKEMGTELANECTNMLIELRNMAYTLGNPATIEDRDLLVLPKPSKELEAFKNKFKKFF